MWKYHWPRLDLLKLVCDDTEYCGVMYDLQSFDHTAAPYCVLVRSTAVQHSVHLVVVSIILRHDLDFAKSPSYIHSRHLRWLDQPLIIYSNIWACFSFFRKHTQSYYLSVALYSLTTTTNLCKFFQLQQRNPAKLSLAGNDGSSQIMSTTLVLMTCLTVLPTCSVWLPTYMLSKVRLKCGQLWISGTLISLVSSNSLYK